MVGVITNSVPMAIFGPGTLYITRNDIAGQTPVNIGYAQEFSYDESAESKELYGQNQYPLVIARGTIKASGKMKAATVSGLALNAVFNGASFAGGQIAMAQAEAQTPTAGTTKTVDGTVPSGSVVALNNVTSLVVGQLVTGHASIPAGTFISSIATPNITLSNALTGALPDTTVLAFKYYKAVTHAADFNQDLGVISATTGLPYAYTSGTPSTGQYNVDPVSGVYAFHSSAGAVLITYAYDVAGSGQTLTVTNTPIGNTPTFQIDYATSLYNKPYYARFFACVSTKLTRAHKLVDFMMPEIDFGFFATAAGNVYSVSYPELS
jgi:hypothetical protein